MVPSAIAKGGGQTYMMATLEDDDTDANAITHT
jgi:hypothetical protein